MLEQMQALHNLVFASLFNDHKSRNLTWFILCIFYFYERNNLGFDMRLLKFIFWLQEGTLCLDSYMHIYLRLVD